jgi:hypothetical protein
VVAKQSGQSAVGGAVAGGAIGLLVGIAAGLSSAPVIAVVVGAISAGLLILLGLKKGDPATESSGNEGAGATSVARIAAFGIVCTLGLLLGVLARAHDVLAPSVTKSVQAWKDAGYPEQQAREIVLYLRAGLTQPKSEGKEGELVANRATAAGAQSGVLFAASSMSVCPYFDRDNYSSTKKMLDAMKLHGGALEGFATALDKVGDAQRDDVVKATGEVICGR